MYKHIIPSKGLSILATPYNKVKMGLQAFHNYCLSFISLANPLEMLPTTWSFKIYVA
jgi:hypothetical protein